MNSMRENSNISHNDAWTKHIRKLSQHRENAQFPAPAAGLYGCQKQGLSKQSKQSKWGK